MRQVYPSTALFIFRVQTRQIICHSALQFHISVTFPWGIELGWFDAYRHGNDARSRQALRLETDKWAVLGTLHNIQTEDDGLVLTHSCLSKLCSILLRQRGTSSQNNSTKQLKPDRRTLTLTCLDLVVTQLRTTDINCGWFLGKTFKTWIRAWHLAQVKKTPCSDKGQLWVGSGVK